LARAEIRAVDAVFSSRGAIDERGPPGGAVRCAGAGHALVVSRADRARWSGARLAPRRAALHRRLRARVVDARDAHRRVGARAATYHGRLAGFVHALLLRAAGEQARVRVVAALRFCHARPERGAAALHFAVRRRVTVERLESVEDARAELVVAGRCRARAE